MLGKLSAPRWPWLGYAVATDGQMAGQVLVLEEGATSVVCIDRSRCTCRHTQRAHDP